MAIITKKENKIDDKLPNIVENFSENVSRVRSGFETAWNYSTKIVRFVFVHKSKPGSKEAQQAYLTQHNRVLSAVPSALNQFIK